MAKASKSTSKSSDDALLHSLQSRFTKNPSRHKGIKWDDVVAKLQKQPKKLEVLDAMEESGGEPDVVMYDKKNDAYFFFDCAPESPAGRRSLCFDKAAWQSRKANKPGGDAMSMAEEMGIQLLNEEQYRYLQTLGEFDLKTSSWILTPANIRQLGGALFCDRRFDTVFTYHNGAESYYAARGFRGWIAV